MKNILLIALILSMYSCTKCEQCTRTWDVESYDLYPDGSITNRTSDQDQTEIFPACSNSDIKAAEGKHETEYSIDFVDYKRVVKYVGECDCK